MLHAVDTVAGEQVVFSGAVGDNVSSNAFDTRARWKSGGVLVQGQLPQSLNWVAWRARSDPNCRVIPTRPHHLAPAIIATPIAMEYLAEVLKPIEVAVWSERAMIYLGASTPYNICLSS